MSSKKKKPKPVPGEYLSLRAYGRHRAELGLSGTSHNAVRKAIDSGRLVDSVHESPKGDRIDPEIADREWEENTTGTKVREPAGGRPPESLFEDEELPPAEESARAKKGKTLQDATTLQAVYRARLLRLDFETRDGALVDRDTVKSEAFRLARLLRENLLKIPTRVAAIAAPLDDVREIRELVEAELLEVLEVLE